jgi:hypothetical protein
MGPAEIQRSTSHCSIFENLSHQRQSCKREHDRFLFGVELIKPNRESEPPATAWLHLPKTTHNIHTTGLNDFQFCLHSTRWALQIVDVHATALICPPRAARSVPRRERASPLPAAPAQTSARGSPVIPSHCTMLWCAYQLQPQTVSGAY